MGWFAALGIHLGGSFHAMAAAVGLAFFVQSRTDNVLGTETRRRSPSDLAWQKDVSGKAGHKRVRRSLLTKKAESARFGRVRQLMF